MNKSRLSATVIALIATSASLIAYAAMQSPRFAGLGLSQEARSPARLQSSETASRVSAARSSRPTRIANAARATAEGVGDVESFKRSQTWLGVKTMSVDLVDQFQTCPPDRDGYACKVIENQELTEFRFRDVARFNLPANASNSLFCHWFSPILSLGFFNGTGEPLVATLSYRPSLTVKNPVLDDPALINPHTGLPFAGRLEVSIAPEELAVPLAPGMWLEQTQRDSVVCIGGFISHRALVDTYGLTERQARQFFHKPTTVEMNLAGEATSVTYALMTFGLRIAGD